MTRSMKDKPSSKYKLSLLEGAVNLGGGIAFCELLNHRIWSQEDGKEVEERRGCC